MSSSVFELNCDFSTAERVLEKIAGSEDYKGTVLFDQFHEIDENGHTCLIMLFHQYAYRVSYKLQADAVVALFDRSPNRPILRVISYEGKGIIKKWFDFCDYMCTVFKDYIVK